MRCSAEQVAIAAPPSRPSNRARDSGQVLKGDRMRALTSEQSRQAWRFSRVDVSPRLDRLPPMPVPPAYPAGGNPGQQSARSRPTCAAKATCLDRLTG